LNSTLVIINKYLVQNDLFDKVLSVGGTNTYCRVKMPYSEEIFKFIHSIKKYTNVIATLKIDKNTNEGTVTFRKG
jgi:hypothetical protein